MSRNAHWLPWGTKLEGATSVNSIFMDIQIKKTWPVSSFLSDGAILVSVTLS